MVKLLLATHGSLLLFDFYQLTLDVHAGDVVAPVKVTATCSAFGEDRKRFVFGLDCLFGLCADAGGGLLAFVFQDESAGVVARDGLYAQIYCVGSLAVAQPVFPATTTQQYEERQADASPEHVSPVHGYWVFRFARIFVCPGTLLAIKVRQTGELFLSTKGVFCEVAIRKGLYANFVPKWLEKLRGSNDCIHSLGFGT